MSDIPLSDDLGRRSGFPWYYPVVFLLNLALIIVLELLLFYRISLPLTEELLEKKDPAYAGSTIVNTTENYTMTWYLVQTDSGELQLVPAQRHDILRDRGRLRLDQPRRHCLYGGPDPPRHQCGNRHRGYRSGTLERRSSGLLHQTPQQIRIQFHEQFRQVQLYPHDLPGPGSFHSRKRYLE